MTLHAGINSPDTFKRNKKFIEMQSERIKELESKVIELENLCAEAMGEQPKEWRDRFKEIIKPSSTDE